MQNKDTRILVTQGSLQMIGRFASDVQTYKIWFSYEDGTREEGCWDP